MIFIIASSARTFAIPHDTRTSDILTFEKLLPPPGHRKRCSPCNGPQLASLCMTIVLQACQCRPRFLESGVFRKARYRHAELLAIQVRPWLHAMCADLASNLEQCREAYSIEGFEAAAGAGSVLS